MPDWQRRFDDHIVLPDGGELATLRDAAQFIMKLPRNDHDAREVAMEALLLVAEHDGYVRPDSDDAGAASALAEADSSTTPKTRQGSMSGGYVNGSQPLRAES